MHSNSLSGHWLERTNDHRPGIATAADGAAEGTAAGVGAGDGLAAAADGAAEAGAGVADAAGPKFQVGGSDVPHAPTSVRTTTTASDDLQRCTAASYVPPVAVLPTVHPANLTSPDASSRDDDTDATHVVHAA
jgi:hypothetical protein